MPLIFSIASSVTAMADLPARTRPDILADIRCLGPIMACS